MWYGESNPLVPPLFNRWGLDAQQRMFKLCMKNNSKVAMESLFDLNPLNHIWRTIHASRVFIHSFL
jgi:hypothetical protein